MFTIFVG